MSSEHRIKYKQRICVPNLSFPIYCTSILVLIFSESGLVLDMVLISGKIAACVLMN